MLGSYQLGECSTCRSIENKNHEYHAWVEGRKKEKDSGGYSPGVGFIKYKSPAEVINQSVSIDICEICLLKGRHHFYFKCIIFLSPFLLFGLYLIIFGKSNAGIYIGIFFLLLSIIIFIFSVNDIYAVENKVVKRLTKRRFRKLGYKKIRVKSVSF
jgi:hypothetical protein